MYVCLFLFRFIAEKGKYFNLTITQTRTKEEEVRILKLSVDYSLLQRIK